MSIYSPTKETAPSGHATECTAIKLSIEPREKDLGGFSVRRVLPYARQRMVGPFIFFDHLGPATFDAGKGIDVRPHPHISLATITYLFDGELMYRDSLGTEQVIRPGAINLMVAGKGIAHSERTPEDLRISGHVLHALQLWIALPEDHEECEPAFYHYPGAELPEKQTDGANIRVMMGSAFGLTSPVKTFSDTLYAEISLSKGAHFTLPHKPELAVYTVSGTLKARGSTIAEHTMAVLEPEGEISVEAADDCRFVIIGGAPLSKRYIWWNFVSSREERIEQAKADWQAGRFAAVPGEDEFIPLPE